MSVLSVFVSVLSVFVSVFLDFGACLGSRRCVSPCALVRTCSLFGALLVCLFVRPFVCLFVCLFVLRLLDRLFV